MFYYLYQFWFESFSQNSAWSLDFKFLNLFKYITFRGGIAFLISFFIVLLMGKRWIAFLKRKGICHSSRSEGSVSALAEFNQDKHSTPIMGGVLVIFGVLISVFLCARLSNVFVFCSSLALLGFGVLGFYDDLKKISSSKGVSVRFKFFSQILLAILILFLLQFLLQKTGTEYFLGASSISFSSVCFPLSKVPLLNLGFGIFFFAILVIIGCSNATNLTDGLDGLAIGCTSIITAAYAFIAYLAGHAYYAKEYLSIVYHPEAGELSIFLLALFGASLGFLWYNCYPAKIFMGDTGSLAIGGAIGVSAFCIKQELLLILIGAIFVIEALSVILQVFSFKFFDGRRIFKMSPLHHHFQLTGVHENQIIVRFLIIGLLLAFMGIGILKLL